MTAWQGQPSCQHARPVNWRNRRVRNQTRGVRPQPWGMISQSSEVSFPAREAAELAKPAECWGYGRPGCRALLSTKPTVRVGTKTCWLPGLNCRVFRPKPARRSLFAQSTLQLRQVQNRLCRVLFSSWPSICPTSTFSAAPQRLHIGEPGGGQALARYRRALSVT